MGDDGIRTGGTKIVGRQTFENFVREPVRGGEREIERGRVRDAAAAEIGGLDFLLVGERLDCSTTAAPPRPAAAWRSFRR
jgi:hypothetical protein